MALKHCALTLGLCCLHPQGPRLRAEGTERLYCLYSLSAPMKYTQGEAVSGLVGVCFPSWMTFPGLRKLFSGRNPSLYQS